MTVKECYEKVGSDYEAVLKRLGSGGYAEALFH